MRYTGTLASQPTNRAIYGTLPCSVPLMARQMETETIVGGQFSSIRLAKLKTIDILLSWQRYGEEELSYIVGGSKSWKEMSFFLEDYLGISIKIKNLYSDSAILLLRTCYILALRKVRGTPESPQ